MTKPSTAEGYSNQVTENCERVLVTLLRGLGPWRDSIFLVGGLTPRYLIERKPPEIPAHAGTGDVDVVIQLQMLNETEAYHSLEDNFKKLGLTRGTTRRGSLSLGAGRSARVVRRSQSNSSPMILTSQAARSLSCPRKAAYRP